MWTEGEYSTSDVGFALSLRNRPLLTTFGHPVRRLVVDNLKRTSRILAEVITEFTQVIDLTSWDMRQSRVIVETVSTLCDRLGSRFLVADLIIEAEAM